jgi:hypothetical protein
MYIIKRKGETGEHASGMFEVAIGSHRAADANEGLLASGRGRGCGPAGRAAVFTPALRWTRTR